MAKVMVFRANKVEEEKIAERAKRERRSVSSFLKNAVLKYIDDVDLKKNG